MKNYQKPSFEIKVLLSTDIITVSNLPTKAKSESITKSQFKTITQLNHQYK